MRYVVGLLAILCLAAVAAAGPEPEKPAEPLQCTIKPLTAQLTLGVPFGLEVTLENTSNANLAIPAPRSDTWCWVQTFQERWSESRGADLREFAMVETAGGTAPADAPAAKDILVLAPKALHRFTVWVLWDDTTRLQPRPERLMPPQPGDAENYWDETTGLPQRFGRFVPPLPGKAEMRIVCVGPADLMKDRAAALQAEPWIGKAESPKVAIDIVQVDPAKAIAMTLQVARRLKAPEDRCLARDALATMTFRHFGKGPGMTKEDLEQFAYFISHSRCG